MNKTEQPIRRMRLKLIEIIQESTCHGFPRVLKTQRTLIKIMWIGLVLVSLAGCSYMIFSLLANYFSYEVVTKIRVLPQVEINFPRVTICNTNPFLTNQSSVFIQKILAENNIGDPYNSSLFAEYLRPKNNLLMSSLGSTYLLQLNAANPNLSDRVRKSFGYTLDEMMISCAIAGAECTENDFIWHYDLIYGNCYSFNSGFLPNGSSVPVRTINKPGLGNALVLEIFAGFDQKNKSSIERVSGIHLFIDDQAYQIDSNNGVDCPKSFQTNIMVEKTTSKLLEKPYSECESDLNSYDNAIFNAVIRSDHKYTRERCFRMCYQKNVSEECNCFDSSSPPFKDDVRACTNLTDIFCDFYHYLAFCSDENIKAQCVPYCPLECETTRFHLSYSFLNYPTDEYAGHLMRLPVVSSKFAPETLTIANVKQSLVSVNAFYGAI
jgi:hypothetical protein